MSPKTVLILSTDATRTGTPLLLRNYLRWIKNNSNLKFVIILENGGELINDFKELGEVYIWDKPFIYFNNRILNFILSKVLNKIFHGKLRAFFFLARIKFKYNISLIFSNSARNGKKLKIILKTIKKNVICYVHEGEKTLDIFNKQGDVNYNLNASCEIITVSLFVKKMLLHKFNLTQNIEIIPGSIELVNNFNNNKAKLRDSYAIEKNHIIIMSCGWLGWHKGTDFFVQVAQSVLSSNKNVHFVWVGGSQNDEAYSQIVFDSKKFNISNKLTIVTSVKDAIAHINMCDIFLMLSREESFSLVTLEASILKKPVLCFEQSGGPCEILNFNKSLIVPYGDIPEMVKRVNNFIRNKEQRTKIGNELYEIASTNYDLEFNASKLLNIIQKNIL